MQREVDEAVEWLEEKPLDYPGYLEWMHNQGRGKDVCGGNIQTRGLFQFKHDHEHYSEYHKACSICVESDYLIVID